ncbi:hypothetical protein B0T22DRAFT_443146 [Podospora appendiculata]|uniref:Uncharacterized protein n=1 Tax=Podospora appendiculata TaxID=314037 RepID=A0AAE0X6T7_9PEZI|nr:hypothetical protein B0T22DRAFT_443146 [Podospora appendiculata]
MASILDDAKATSIIPKLTYGIDATAIILCTFVAGSAIHQLANSRHIHLYNEAPATDDTSNKEEEPPGSPRPRRDLLLTRVLLLAAAVSAIVRSGLHIVCIQAETSRRYVRANGVKSVPAGDRARNLAYLWFEIGAVVFFFTALVHLQSRFFLWALTPTRRRLSRLEGGLLVGGFFVLWLVVCVSSTVAGGTSKGDLEGIVNSSIVSIYILCAWIIVTTIAITTSALTKLIHASRAKMICLERATLARFSMVAVPILVADIALIVAAFVANYAVDVVVEVLGASVVLVWAVEMVRKLGSCPER